MAMDMIELKTGTILAFKYFTFMRLTFLLMLNAYEVNGDMQIYPKLLCLIININTNMIGFIRTRHTTMFGVNLLFRGFNSSMLRFSY